MAFIAFRWFITAFVGACWFYQTFFVFLCLIVFVFFVLLFVVPLFERFSMALSIVVGFLLSFHIQNKIIYDFRLYPVVSFGFLLFPLSVFLHCILLYHIHCLFSALSGLFCLCKYFLALIFYAVWKMFYCASLGGRCGEAVASPRAAGVWGHAGPPVAAFWKFFTVRIQAFPYFECACLLDALNASCDKCGDQSVPSSFLRLIYWIGILPRWFVLFCQSAIFQMSCSLIASWSVFEVISSKLIITKLIIKISSKLDDWSTHFSKLCGRTHNRW